MVLAPKGPGVGADPRNWPKRASVTRFSGHRRRSLTDSRKWTTNDDESFNNHYQHDIYSTSQERSKREKLHTLIEGFYLRATRETCVPNVRT